MDVLSMFGFVLDGIVEFLSRPIPLGGDVEVSIFAVMIASALGGLLFAVVGKLFGGKEG